MLMPFFGLHLFILADHAHQYHADLSPHAGGAGILGMYMLVCGFFQPVGQLPEPVWRYPMHYIAYHSYAFAGFMRNE